MRDRAGREVSGVGGSSLAVAVHNGDRRLQRIAQLRVRAVTVTTCSPTKVDSMNDCFEWLIGPRPWTWKRIRRRCRGGCLACQWALVGTPIATWMLYSKATQPQEQLQQLQQRRQQ